MLKKSGCSINWSISIPVQAEVLIALRCIFHIENKGIKPLLMSAMTSGKLLMQKLAQMLCNFVLIDVALRRAPFRD